MSTSVAGKQRGSMLATLSASWLETHGADGRGVVELAIVKATERAAKPGKNVSAAQATADSKAISKLTAEAFLAATGKGQPVRDSDKPITFRVFKRSGFNARELASHAEWLLGAADRLGDKCPSDLMSASKAAVAASKSYGAVVSGALALEPGLDIPGASRKRGAAGHGLPFSEGDTVRVKDDARAMFDVLVDAGQLSADDLESLTVASIAKSPKAGWQVGIDVGPMRLSYDVARTLATFEPTPTIADAIADRDAEGSDAEGNAA